MRQPKEFFRHYFMSPLGILNITLSLALGIFLFFFWSPVGGIVSASGIFLILLVFGIFSGLGIRSAVSEQDRRFWQEIQDTLSGVEKASERLAGMRIANEAVRKLTQLAAMKSREYLQACRKNQTHDPAASYAVTECVEMIDLFLTELNETAVEKRFQLADAHEFQNPEERICVALQSKISQIDKATLAFQGGISASDRFSIKEDLS